MLKKLAIACAALAFTVPAHAVTTEFKLNQATMPDWTTASFIQQFPTLGALNTGVGNTAPISSQALTAGGSANVAAAGAGTFFGDNVGGNFLVLSNKSYTINFSTAQQFIGFLIQDFKGSNSLKINGQATNLFTGVTGLDNGADGLFYIDMEGAAGITSITFGSTQPGVGNRMQIDQIASAAPEPATWGMMIVGFGIIGSQLHRRRREDRAGVAAAA